MSLESAASSFMLSLWTERVALATQLTPAANGFTITIMERTCGTCTLCCKVLGVDEVSTPRSAWCQHCDKKSGCKIYDQRPSACREFICLWLVDTSVPDDLRPDKCKVVFYANEHDCFVADCDPGYPHAWLDPRVRMMIDKIVEEFGEIYVKAGANEKHIRNDGIKVFVTDLGKPAAR
jgi:hypothetical protein